MTRNTPPDLSRLPYPPIAEPRPFRSAPFSRFRLGNGFEVLLVEDHTVPLVFLNCVFPAGAHFDPPGLEGLALLTIPLLREGTERRTANQISEQAEDLGADIISNVDWDSGSLAVEFLAKDMEFGTDLLFDLLTAPTFPLAAVENYKRRHIARLTQQQWQPSDLADDWFARLVYADTIYGRPLLGNAASLNKVSRDDLVDFHRAHFHMKRTIVIGVGSFHVEKLGRLLESIYPATNDLGIIESPVIVAPLLSTTKIYLIDIPDAVQTEMRLGHAGLPRSHPEFARVQLLTTILGSRLNLSLRESKGYTYFVRTRFLARSGPAPFIVSASVENSHVNTAVCEIVEEIARLQEEPVSEAELVDAKNLLIGSFLRSFQSNYEMAEQLKKLVVNEIIEKLNEQGLTGMWQPVFCETSNPPQ